MSKPVRQADAAQNAASPDTTPGGLVGLLHRLFTPIKRLRDWARVSRTRSIAIAGTMLLLIATTIGGWAYLASVAIEAGLVSPSETLTALDEGRIEDARIAVNQLLRSGQLPPGEYGGQLFALGAIKTHDAESNLVPERRRVEYLVASRYLKEARAYGLPPERENDAAFLLGLSLLESNQFDDGLEELEKLLADKLRDGDPLIYETHRLLAETCLTMPHPQLEKSLQHNSIALENEGLTSDDRADLLLQRADCLARLNRFEEAREALALLPVDANRRANLLLLQGRITLDELDRNLRQVATSDRDKLIAEWKPKTSLAVESLRQAESLDPQRKFIARQASYQIGRGLELQGDSAAALRQLTDARQEYPESLEGLAAGLGEADLQRQKGDYAAALLGYRRVLESFASATNYRSDVLSLDQLRARVMSAVSDFVDHQHFEEALKLIALLRPMFSRAEQLSIEGDTLQQWGNLLLGQSTDEDERPSPSRTDALRHLRAAGLAFEQLAELNFSNVSYTDDLWRSAENYFRGHSFSRTISQLDKYLKYEPELRNAEALLHLGQANLALGQIAPSIAAFEECIEFHPQDSATYQARIDCAKAYRYQGNAKRSEELLFDNIAGSSLKPSSREWKDSLFELGVLLHETGRHDQAIGRLEEAVERYPQDRQTLMAKYLIGESYRLSAIELLERAEKSSTSAERHRDEQAANERLRSALENFKAAHSTITQRAHEMPNDLLLAAMRRNCYMLEGSVLSDLGRYQEAIEAYSNVSSLYPDEPFVLETFVQIANCWRRLGRVDTARLTMNQAQLALERLPPNADFETATCLKRDEWKTLLANMSRW